MLWFCAVRPSGIVDMTRTLEEAQHALQGDGLQAIIPMRGGTPHHPAEVASKWEGGSARWTNEHQIEAFQVNSPQAVRILIMRLTLISLLVGRVWRVSTTSCTEVVLLR